MKYQMPPAAAAITPVTPIATRIFFMCVSRQPSVHGPARNLCRARDTVLLIGSRRPIFHGFEWGQATRAGRPPRRRMAKRDRR